MPVTIRSRTDDDLPVLTRILQEVHALDGYPVEGVDDPQAWLTLARPLGVWVAELDGKVVGHVALTEPEPGDEAPRLYAQGVGREPTAVLGRLFVSPTARGHGAANRLINAATRAAMNVGRRVVLDVMLKDRAAIRLYERLAWTPLGHFHHRHGRGAEPAIAMVAPATEEKSSATKCD